MYIAASLEMDEETQDQSQKKFNKYKFFKRTLQLVIPVSVFSFFLWYSSGFSILPQSFNAYFSTCLFSMLTRTLERKYMFLICNAILALLVKTSILTSSSPPMSPFDLEYPASTNAKAQVSEDAIFPLKSFRLDEEEIERVKKQEAYYEQVSEDEGEEHGTDTLFTESEGRVNEAFIAEEEDVAGKDERDLGSGVMETEDDELADTTSVASIDELNRKFEEFIRKMKEEMKIEAQRQPIVV